MDETQGATVKNYNIYYGNDAKSAAFGIITFIIKELIKISKVLRSTT